METDSNPLVWSPVHSAIDTAQVTSFGFIIEPSGRV